MTEAKPAPDDDQALERGRLLFAQECRFVTGAAHAEQLPTQTLPEVAFAGRSNVGKSSLINALTGRRSLARISNTPGRTRQLNFFDLGGRLMLVDLPGYGYAKAAKGEVKAWNRLILAYLRGRPNLARLTLLIDGRHGLKASDVEIMTILDAAALSYQLVLTKCDKVPPRAVAAHVDAALPVIARHPACHPAVVATSAETGQGLPELRAELASFAPNG
jgi:GTP-binding protein